MLKKVSFKTLGMQRDKSESAFESKYAYENMNMRVMPTDDNTLMSLVNERGNLAVPIGLSLNGNSQSSHGTVIGYSVYSGVKSEGETMHDFGVLFEKNPSLPKDTQDIIRIVYYDQNSGGFTLVLLYQGDLGFSLNNPIETIAYFENADIQKVYWTDGLNPPRYINIPDYLNSNMNPHKLFLMKYNKKQDWFNFVSTIDMSGVSIKITREDNQGGVFPAGVVQYAFTYLNGYGNESNIFYTSSLYYSSFTNRGGSPENTVNNVFNIAISQPDESFDYIRVYQIMRTSLNGTATVKRVVDLKIDGSDTINYTDNNLNGETVDPTELLYVGGRDITIGTMTSKDNTLFAGDIHINEHNIATLQLDNKNLEDCIKSNATISWVKHNSAFSLTETGGQYIYDNQLKYSTDDNPITIFKYGETYRLGFQAQYKTGHWSDVIWIDDSSNDNPIEMSDDYNNAHHAIVYKPLITLSDTVIQLLRANNYIAVRPVIVYPSINDRTIKCQGVLCPTVFNAYDRYTNSPFALSSWFFRPMAPFDVSTADTNPSVALENTTRTGVLSEEIVHKGAWAEFRHNYPLRPSWNRNGEIQSMDIASFYELTSTDTQTQDPVYSFSESKYNRAALIAKQATDKANETQSIQRVSAYSDFHFVDQSILTMHSPDLEFDYELQHIDTKELKLRIIGIVPITSFSSDIEVKTSTAVLTKVNSKGEIDTDSIQLIPPGFYKEPYKASNLSGFGYRQMITAPFWFDGCYPEFTAKKVTTDNQVYYFDYVLYPWHRIGSLNNTKSGRKETDNSQSSNYKSALLEEKILSNLRFSYDTQYFTSGKYWEPDYGISGVSVFNSDTQQLMRIPAVDGSDIGDLNYYGNIDKLLTIPAVSYRSKGYQLMVSAECKTKSSGDMNKMITSEYLPLENIAEATDTGKNTESYSRGVDPILIRYKSTIHAVVALNGAIRDTHLDLEILPLLSVSGNIINNVSSIYNDGTQLYHPFWLKNNETIYEINQNSVLNPTEYGINNTSSYGFLYLAELYTDNVVNRFGGDTKGARENNKWLPCGNPVNLTDATVKPMDYLLGDTYYQRYDCLKTYAYTEKDKNQIVDILSFMCETHVNIDGRYDKNRGQTSNLYMSPKNFNLMNSVYSLQNNFFIQRAINTDKIHLNNFKNSITWTKTKTAGSLRDDWTNITLASTLDLDGDKGLVTSLERLNNNVIAFLRNAISQILYNENVQLSTTQGVPVEIANSGKVLGKRYITNTIGCNNKWSIANTPSGIYFIDGINKGILLLSPQGLQSISDSKGFHSWINQQDNLKLWTPYYAPNNSGYNSTVTFYDKTAGDVFFTTKDTCLAFSEPLQEFSSFYNYEKTNAFFNLDGNGIAFHQDNSADYNNSYDDIWLHNQGDFNYFFGKYKPFYTKVLVNPDFITDKIFDNIEFRADTFNVQSLEDYDRYNENYRSDKSPTYLADETFDRVEVLNEYQLGKMDLEYKKYLSSNLKKKFKIWRANLPRATLSKDTLLNTSTLKLSHRDRIRSLWIYLKLSKERENRNKTVLHDLTVQYFEN